MSALFWVLAYIGTGLVITNILARCYPEMFCHVPGSTADGMLDDDGVGLAMMVALLWPAIFVVAVFALIGHIALMGTRK